MLYVSIHYLSAKRELIYYFSVIRELITRYVSATRELMLLPRYTWAHDVLFQWYTWARDMLLQCYTWANNMLLMDEYLTANQAFICILDIQESESKLHTGKACGVEVEIYVHSFLNWVLDGEWSPSRLGRPLYRKERAPVSHRMGGCVGLVAGPDIWWHRKLSSSCRKPNNDPSAVQPVANKNSHHKDCDIASPQTHWKRKNLYASVSYWFQQADI